MKMKLRWDSVFYSIGRSRAAILAIIAVSANAAGTEIDDPIPQKIAKGDITIELQTVADGLVSPVGMAAPDDGSGRLFVYDQIGLIRVIDSGTMLDAPLLDVQNRLVALSPGYDERGLVGLATHPNFAQHPFIYTYTSEPAGPKADFPIVTEAGVTNDCQSVIAEWRIDPANPNRVDPASRREILRVDKPQSNHNGGTMRFGPDGFLYFTIGDGGMADDQGDGHSPGGNGQDTTKILGKISRIDVDARTSPNGQYGIPAQNPFVGQAGMVQEIYAYGLRNPYSFSFDRQTGDIFLGDVGQNDIEEVDHILKGGNYGWPIKEGGFFFDPNGTNDGFVTTMPVRDVPPGLIDPIAQYDHDEGDAVIGGYVYRGGLMSNLRGKYVTGDLGESDENKFGRLFFLDGSQVKELRIGSDDRPLGMYLKGFGEDRNGELYVLGTTNIGPAGTAGKVLKIVPARSAVAENSFVQHNLVSDIAGLADNTDSQLVNPWGMAYSPSSPFWVNDNGTGLSTIYNGAGVKQSLVVTIPSTSGAGVFEGMPASAPTGIIFNDTPDFQIGTAASRFIFDSEDGVISAWDSGTNAVLMVNNSTSQAIYKGLAKGNFAGTNYLYAADFHNAKIDVFDGTFKPAALPGAFADPGMPAGFAPFNIQNLGGQLYVTYAKQDDDKEDDVAGAGNGYINIFDTAGHLLRRFASQGALNSPWGLAIAPAGFGPFAGALLAGNFGDGRINAYDLVTRAALGGLNDSKGSSISIEGLWALSFGNGSQSNPNILYFTAGISGGGEIEDHGLFGSISVTPPPNSFTQHNLVSDIAGLADHIDPQLANPWGAAFTPSGPFWVNDNGTGVATIYDAAGLKQSLVVTIPTASGGTPPSAPTGMQFNDTTDFQIGGAASKFIFASEDGIISAWNGGTNAVLAADNSGSDAIYKGIAQGSSGGTNYLYAADFHNAKIDVFDSAFKPAALPGSFLDTNLPAGFAPFNIYNLGGQLYVTYAKQDDDKEDDVPGAGNGYINIFDTAGRLVKRFASQGALNSPWGLAIAPPDFGPFGGALLAGNFGDGRINAFDPATGLALGQLEDTKGKPISIEGLWALRFGNGAQSDSSALYFTAGISGGGEIEDHGLFGSIASASSSAPSFVISQFVRNGNDLTITWSGGTGPFTLQKKASLSDAAWTGVKTLPDTSVTITIEGAAGFFRIQGKNL